MSRKVCKEWSFVGQLLFVENLFSRSELFLERSRAFVKRRWRRVMRNFFFFPFYCFFFFFFRWHRRSIGDEFDEERTVANETGSILLFITY